MTRGWIAVGIGIGVTVQAASGAFACSPIRPKRAEVYHGEQCAVSYSQPHEPQFVRSFAAKDLGHGIIRQSIQNGICGSGERIVTYFDCATKTGAWLGGPINGGGKPPIPLVDAVPVVEIEGYGIDDAFIAHEEPRLGDGLRPAAVLARARQLPWVAQSGVIESPRMVLDGKRFDINCGCKLFLQNGVH